MGFGDGVHDRQAQPGAGQAAGSVGAVEAVEDAGQLTRQVLGVAVLLGHLYGAPAAPKGASTARGSGSDEREPDLLRLVSRLARDKALPRRTRWLLWILAGYLALPIDLVPDFIPVLGYADDAIAVALVLRTVIRQSGTDALARHWPGTPDGLNAVCRLAGAPAAPQT
ncbi:YkvA family protein [Streptomyces sp. NPDC002671]